MEDNTPDFSQHRAIISHALKSEPAQIQPIFNQIVRDKIADRIEIRRGEVANTLFGDVAGDTE